MQLWGPAFLLKKTPFHFTCCKEHLWTTASKLYSRRDSNTDVFLCILWIIQEHPFVEDLRTTGSEIPVRGSLFNKVVYLTTWSSLTVLETESSKGIPQWILRNFEESVFVEHLLATSSHIMFFLSFLQIIEVCRLKSIYLVEKWKIQRMNLQAR